MNRLANTNRKYLLGTVSAIALLTSIAIANPALAEESGGNPEVWIELGGGFDQMDNTQAIYQPPFMAVPQPFRDFSVGETEKPTRSALNFDGSITFQPDNSDWVLSAKLLYGRSKKRGHLMQAQPSVSCFYSSFVGFLVLQQCARFCGWHCNEQREPHGSRFQGGKGCRAGPLRKRNLRHQRGLAVCTIPVDHERPLHLATDKSDKRHQPIHRLTEGLAQFHRHRPVDLWDLRRQLQAIPTQASSPSTGA